MHRKSSGPLRPDHENLELNQDLRYINLPPEEIPTRGRITRHLDIYRKIREKTKAFDAFGPEEKLKKRGWAFYVPCKNQSPDTVRTALNNARVRYGLPPFNCIRAGRRLYIYWPPRTVNAAPAATSEGTSAPS